ncbi:Pseudouridine-5'-phosphate glycosidase [Jeotgalicoccus aerolatus]|uniref:Pseudouridine-5'-phosphate glycosidase n=1 Tax=Jeotgalicoccus aerolatus TaxID=709510 RepID=A0ABS4HPC4_9STAP|nr:pseudouridine-5'-phosphate glycosidase [Jeotgalicoccus aerolatus]MBP1952703.1 pseudouridine-5'-phosphate glycosidase [Jeotgalicoccus aerolatus]NMA81336.1 pseudouridine-5'-phosphate glycosidase [Jeotgalicoccus aerolatus]GGD91561.1 pseudouridine-5'-phosphate glycosidase [Jeotgalicoccus aerolatus]CAD2073820.1 Pseudouridine-5'-phosphate glycosidase [Jeotgalicoccus aerolatus]
MNHLIELHPDVKAALDSNKPVIALESTIISHGMPYPQNIEMAKKVEDIVREGGATPATIAIMDGKIKVGLDEASLEKLGNSEGVAKVSRRDLAEIVATKRIGATTVASTMICAEMAGIKFFVTGGIGGVHRGVEDTMDISADLDELGKTDVAVICAGAKSILDLDRTMEYLETKGVPVIGYKTDVLPAFFTRTSDIKLNTTADSTEEIASIIKAKHDLELGGGTVIANPILESDELPKEYIDQIVMEAVQEAEEKGIGGKDSTPFLLGKIVEKTEGKSLDANIKLVYNNAKVGTQIAVDYFNKQ